VATLRDEGSVTIPNFLSPEALEDVTRRTYELMEREQSLVREIHHGPNTLRVLTQRETPIAGELKRFYDDPRLRAIFTAVERTPNAYDHCHKAIESLEQGQNQEIEDPETKLHSDIFFSTHKAWLYLTDVTPVSAPLVYVNRSRGITPKALGYIYRESCNGNAGSRRITPQELEDLGLTEKVFAVQRNTLVVADTHGYHRRLLGEPGEKRLALHASLRGNPFAWWR
jgi:hypothetical protein